MTKSELTKKIHQNNDLNYVQIDDIVTQVFNEIAMALQSEDKVVISGFGTFEKYFQESYEGVNPATGEPLQIEGNYKIRFSASKKLKDSLK
jgi:nucleoid DNA-binding protein